MKYLLTVLTLFSGILFAQDTLKVMQYNLLDYGGANSPTNKNPHLKTIINDILPDVFTVNELSNNSLYADNILVNVLNTNGRSYYQRCTYTNQANSNVVNMLFYNSNKLGFHSQYTILHSLRDMNAYKLYYKDPSLAQTQDTVFIIFVVAHLKAAQGFETDRDNMANNIMTYLNGLANPGNICIQGDFNLYTSTEPAYQRMITHSNTQIKMYDPINTPGNWSNDNSYKNIHTQSTRVNTEADGGSGGGSDDRFDFILINQSVKDSLNGIRFIPGSYKAYGQDGNHFNGAVNSGNTAVSAAIANALYAMSDHHPVVLQLKVRKSNLTALENSDVKHWYASIYGNPVQQELHVKLFGESNKTGSIQIRNISGQLLISEKVELQSNGNQKIINLNGISEGMYFLEWVHPDGFISSQPFVKN